MRQTASTLSVNLTTGAITQSTPISARSSLAITLTGTGSLVAANMKAALYRLNVNGIDGTLVATCDTFSGPLNAFVGAMSLNTAELVAAFTNLEAVREYETLEFTLLIYDATQAVYTIYDHINVSYEYPLAAGTPPSVSPISVGTDTFGDLKLHAGSLYKQSPTDGLWYKWGVAGAGTQVHETLDNTGIAL